RQQRMARRLIQSAVDDGVDLILYLEDDIDFNRHLRTNILSWPPVARFRSGDHFYASLFNAGSRVKLRRPEDRCFVARPESVTHSQALIVSTATARVLLRDWELVPG